MARSKKLSGINPLAYIGVEPTAPPQVVLERRRPTTNDYSDFNIGTWWLWVADQEVWVLISKDGGNATWIQLYPSAGGGTSTYITDAGSANEVDGDINISGGSNINTVGAADVVTVNLNNSINLSGTIITAGNITCGTTVTSSEVVTGNDITCGGKLTAATGVDITAGGIDSTGTTRFRDFTTGTLQSDATGTITSNPSAGANVAFSYYYATSERFAICSIPPVWRPLGSVTPLTRILDLAGAFFPGDGAGSGAKFNAPITGTYCLCGNFWTGGVTSGSTHSPRIRIITSSKVFESYPVSDINALGLNSIEVCVNLTAGDIVTYEVYQWNPPTYIVEIAGTDSGMIQSWIHGYLVD